MTAEQLYRSITTAPPPLRPALPPRRPAPRRHRFRMGPTPAERARRAAVRAGAGAVAGTFVGCITGAGLGAACSLLDFFLGFVPGSHWSDWGGPMGLLVLLLFLALFGGALGATVGLLVGGAVGAPAGLLRGGRLASLGGAALGAALSPLLLAGNPWDGALLQTLVALAGALGGWYVARTAGADVACLP